MKIASAQILIAGGDWQGNLQRALAAIREAKSLGAEVVVLPECSNFGWTHSSARTHAVPLAEDEFVASIQQLAAELRMYVAVGFVERDGDELFNAAVLISNHGELLAHHRKINELDFARELYSTGSSATCVETPLGKLGLMICADALSEEAAVPEQLVELGAEVILSPCAWAVPPGHDNTQTPYGQLWFDAYRRGLKQSKSWVIAASNVGAVTDGEWDGHFCIGNSIALGPGQADVVVLPFGVDAVKVQLIEV